MPASVDRSKYFNSYVKNPRGWGRWGFYFSPDSGQFWFTGNFGKALVAAQKQATKRKATRIIVLP